MTAVDEIPDAHEPIDFVYEATDYAPHAFQCVNALAPNGIAALLGIPRSRKFEVDGGALYTELVLHNECLVGSVNTGVGYFDRAAESVAAMPDDLLNHLVATVTDPEHVAPAFVDDEEQIKAVVEFDAL